MNWNWDNFGFFLVLADSQTLIATAAELDVSHTAVLRRIKAFESQIGTQTTPIACQSTNHNRRWPDERFQIVSWRPGHYNITLLPC